jgi:hypothetical protein
VVGTLACAVLTTILLGRLMADPGSQRALVFLALLAVTAGMVGLTFALERIPFWLGKRWPGHGAGTRADRDRRPWASEEAVAMEGRMGALWGGQLVAVSLEPVAHSVRFDVVVPSGNDLDAYRLTCREVSSFSFSNSIPLPWTYAEVTEIYVGRGAVAPLLVEMILWSEDCVIQIECGDWHLERA